MNHHLIIILSLLAYGCCPKNAAKIGSNHVILDAIVRSIPGVPEEYESAAFPETQAVVFARTLAIRNFPGLEGKLVGFLKKGDKIAILGTEGDWHEIAGNHYISRHFVKITSNLLPLAH